jgi:hypothetical protein
MFPTPRNSGAVTGRGALPADRQYLPYETRLSGFGDVETNER